ncbi:MAG: hypothetical protein KGI45_02820 [Patescibacteria group bacterium]|nr:hypothetical protein [Patescibacteria group bacterium]MDE1966979.1 hypothetical protein [Patescibacteria group bacterium]
MKMLFRIFFRTFFPSFLAVGLAGPGSIRALASSLPAFMPVASLEREWLATNGPCTISIILKCTNSAGGLNQSCGPYRSGLSFSSYADLSSYVRYTSRWMNRLWNKSGSDSDVRWTVSVQSSAYDQNGILRAQTVFWIDGDIGAAASVSDSSFSLDLNAIDLVAPVPGLASASFQSGSQPPTALTVGSGGMLVMPSSLSSIAGRSRLRLVMDDGSVASYTQDGTLISPPSAAPLFVPAMPPDPWYYDPYPDYLSAPYDQMWSVWIGWWDEYEWVFYAGALPGSWNVVVQGTVGADNAVQWTADLRNWSDLGAISWDSGQGSFVAPFTNEVDRAFFRAVSY